MTARFPAAAAAAGLALGLTLALLAAAAPGAEAQSHPLRVQLVATGGWNSFLLRGPSPLNRTTGEFDREWLVKEARFRLARHNHAMPPRFDLVVVSLLTTEHDDNVAERRYFEENPGAGTFTEWPMWGLNDTYVAAACERLGAGECHGAQPHDYDATTLRAMSRGFEPALDPDRVMDRVQELRRLVSSQTPTLVYFHSEDGADRAGLLAAAYEMRYMRRTFSWSMERDYDVPEKARRVHYSYQTYAQWFCQYLDENGMYAHGDDCLLCNTPFTRCSDPDAAPAPAGP